MFKECHRIGVNTVVGPHQVGSIPTKRNPIFLPALVRTYNAGLRIALLLFFFLFFFLLGHYSLLPCFNDVDENRQ
jgi:hypothetical protein